MNGDGYGSGVFSTLGSGYQWYKHWDNNVSRPLGAWVHDFSAARNAAAHSPGTGQKGSIWSPHNHLIFSAR